MSRKKIKTNESFSESISRILVNIIHALAKTIVTLIALIILFLLLYVVLLAKPNAERELFEDQVRLQMGSIEK